MSDLWRPCGHEADYDPHWIDDEECPGWFKVDFEAIVDADPRWVRRGVLGEAQAEWSLTASNLGEATRMMQDMKRHWVQVTQDCKPCRGTGRYKGGRITRECRKCGGSGKVPADGVDIIRLVSRPVSYLIPVDGSDDE